MATDDERREVARRLRELKPCPCCGSSNGLYVLQEDEYGEWSVFCDMCKTSLHNENYCETRDEAVSAWNRRAERTCHLIHEVEEEDDEFFDTVELHYYVCSECGWNNRPDAYYCDSCGAKVVER